MGRRFVGYLLLGMAIFLPLSQASAVIKASRPLQVFLSDSHFIFVAKIDKFFPEKPALVLTVQEDLKGKADQRRLPVMVKVDAKAENQNYIPAILKRLAANQEIILFVQERGKKSIGVGFTNGSWFHVLGERVDKDKTVWSLESGEPVLRQTFRGSTVELRQLIIESLAGKKKPPDVDEKVKPGFGPEVRFARPSPLFAVIPTITFGAPLAILAVLFPTVFGGMLILFRQWLAFITVVSLNSTLFLLYIWQGFRLRGTWWGSEAGLWFVMTMVALGGTVWAWSRQVKNLSLGAGAIQTPRKTETRVLWIMTILTCGAAVFLAVTSVSYTVADYLLFAVAFGSAVGTMVHLIRGWFFSHSWNPGRSTEGILLSAVLLAQLSIAGWRWSSNDVSGAAEIGAESVAHLVGLRWDFKVPGTGLFVASPWIEGDRIYAAAASPGFKVGTLYCVDRASGKKIWEFIGDGDLKNMISSPCVAEGRVYLGEGFHDDLNCKLWCVEAATGSLVWNFQTKGQTESSPIVVAGKVYFGAGNDGLYCLDAGTGRELWHFPDQDYHGRLLRFGGGPAVIEGRVYAATGIDRNRVSSDPGETALFCLDAQTGKVIWKVDTKLPAWGAPVVSKGQIFLGLGNGDLFEDAKDRTLGAMLCLDAKTGEEIWQCAFGNGVLDRPAVDEQHVYLGCRSGHVYCLDRKDGKRTWKTALDSPVIAAPALAQWCGQSESVFAVATGGKVCCLDPQTGAIGWTYNLTKQKPHLSAAPKVVVSRTAEGERRQLYFGAGIGDIVSGQAVLYCLEDRTR